MHNVKTALGELLDYTYNPTGVDVEPTQEAFFNGYIRKNGKVGVRNDIWIIPTVGCVNSVVHEIEHRAKEMLSKAAGITVYGYGAPVTDVEAVELMKSERCLLMKFRTTSI